MPSSFDIISLVVVLVFCVILGIVWGVLLGIFIPRLRKKKIEKNAVKKIEKMQKDGYSYRYREDLAKEGITIDLNKQVKEALEQNGNS